MDQQNSVDNSSCLVSNNPNVSCKSLDWVFNVTHRSNQTVFILSSGTHYLSSPVATFQDLNNITFVGAGRQETVIECTMKDIAFCFERVTNFNLSYFSIVECSTLQNSTSKNYNSQSNKLHFVPIYVTLYFYLSENLVMDSINVCHSPDGGIGVVVYNTIGTNIIKNSVFSNNRAPTNTLNGGGGGFYVEFTFCIPGDENCSDEVDSYTDRNHDATYVFENCLFENNIASSFKSSNAIYIVPFRSNHNALGRGGGLSIFLKANASNNHINVTNCHFENNTATWGGGLFVEFHDNTSGNVITIESSVMVNNYCPFTPKAGTGGGGMRLGHYVFRGNVDLMSVSNYITITDCTFSNNAALNGGGLSISPAVQNVELNQVANVSINQSNFTNNVARLGAALHVSRFAMIPDGNILNVMVQHCTFESNSNDYIVYLQEHEEDYNKTAYQPGLGAVYVNQVPVAFQSIVYFTQNNGSALVAVGASLDFSSCKALFYENRGMNGGAITLLGLAWLRINDNTFMGFQGNIATLNGGAIYNKFIEGENLITYVNCFVRHTNYYTIGPEDWNSTFNFDSNYDLSGNRNSSIYSTSILPCAWAGGNLEDQIRKVFCWSEHWNYSGSPSGNCSDQIYSDIGDIQYSSQSNIEAFPGRQFSMPLHIVDDLDHSLHDQTVFSTSLNDHQNSSSKSVKYIRELTTAVEGNENSTSKLLLDSIGNRVWHITIDIVLKNCPPGFYYNKEKQKCKCLNAGAVSCDLDSQNAYLETYYWMGKIQDYEDYVVAICPAYYCSSNNTLPLPNSTDELNTQICGQNNCSGTLCGRCENGSSVAVNSPHYKCVYCSEEDHVINRLTYVASVYIPLTILFSSIILFSIRLTSAPANAFILFSQMVSSTFDLNADGQISFSSFPGNNSQGFVDTYKIIYGIFNLEFVEQFLDPFCVGDLDTLDVISLDYAVAIFPLVMIVAIVLLYKMKGYFRCISCSIPNCISQRMQSSRWSTRKSIQSSRWSTRKSILPAFAAFFLLSFNKFSMTSSFLVRSQPLLSADGVSINTALVHFDGHYFYSDPLYHSRYLIPASIVFATFVAIPSILLLDFPIKAFEMCLFKVQFLWRWYPVDKVHILLDTFQGYFKNKMRCFAGLYFLFRLAVDISYTTTNSWLTQYLIQQILCLVMAALLLVCQPYNEENKLFNIIDPLIFFNLGVLNVISLYLLSVTKLKVIQNTDLTFFFFLLQCILVLLPLLCMLTYIVWYFIKAYIKRLELKLNEFIRSKTARYRTCVSTRHLELNSESDTAASAEEVLLRRAQSRNTYCPHTTTVVAMENETSMSTSNTYGSTNNSAQSLKNRSTLSNK